MFAKKAKSEHGTLAECLPAARRWFATERGRFLLKTEQRTLDRLLPRMFGHHASTLGILPDASLLDSTQIVHKTFLTPLAEVGGAETVRLSVNEWPIQPRSMNMVLLHHTLEFAERPHRILREACRAIMPGGRLVVVGFNPISLWNPVRMIGLGEDRIMRRARFYHPGRITDWLTLLNFRACHLHFGGALFPLTTRLHPRRRRRMENYLSTSQIPMGSFYILVAIKERSGLIPYDRRWRSAGNRLFGGTTACTAADMMKENS